MLVNVSEFGAEVFNHSEIPAQLHTVPYQIVYNDGGWNRVVISGMAMVQTSQGTVPAGSVREFEDSFSVSDRQELSRYFRNSLEIVLLLDTGNIQLDMDAN